ncbi:hypothetical protein [Actinoplanes awajinensis]|uniref:Uncharacterized protein n=1 Tax=Actinoplanes awajinensis subsp. mycoplanecinus TaxID=135947 RepID=A0A101JFE2_9ACTN|nr:hypothetical protein [Actinoplanes awajinensis]KUL25793.1 hypothetical protein ADL15_39435 [Actinoplanes awajinensis subsp. mycoplanecinus]
MRFRDGSAAVVDVRPDDRIEPEDAAKFAASTQACASVGWDTRGWAGYRRRRVAGDDLGHAMTVMRLVDEYAARRVDA